MWQIHTHKAHKRKPYQNKRLIYYLRTWDDPCHASSQTVLTGSKPVLTTQKNHRNSLRENKSILAEHLSIYQKLSTHVVQYNETEIIIVSVGEVRKLRGRSLTDLPEANQQVVLWISTYLFSKYGFVRKHICFKNIKYKNTYLFSYTWHHSYWD